jgi:hypothetical protein
LSRICALNREVNESEEIDEAAQGKILHEKHDSILGGHCGVNEIYKAIREHYY